MVIVVVWHFAFYYVCVIFCCFKFFQFLLRFFFPRIQYSLLDALELHTYIVGCHFKDILSSIAQLTLVYFLPPFVTSLRASICMLLMLSSFRERIALVLLCHVALIFEEIQFSLLPSLLLFFLLIAALLVNWDTNPVTENNVYNEVVAKLTPPIMSSVRR